MSWSEVTGWVGFLIILAGAGLIVHQVARRMRQMRARPPGTAARRLESGAEIASQAVLFGGAAVMNLASFAEHLSTRTLPTHLWLTLSGNAAILLLLGVHLGRLLMRWQLQQLGAMGARLDPASGEFSLPA